MSELALDAHRPRDPTGTAGHRRSFRAAAKLRVNQLRAAMRVAIMEHDVLGLGGAASVMAYHPQEVRLRAFSSWLAVTARHTLGGPWLSWYIARAWHSGEVVAAKQLETSPIGETSGHVLELARLELDGIIAAIVQQLSREAARIVTHDRLPRVTAWRRLSACLDKIGPPRVMALANTITVDAHNRAKIAIYRHQGVERVGIIPELLTAHAHSLRMDAQVEWTKGESGRFTGSRGSGDPEVDEEINSLWKEYKSGEPGALQAYGETMLARCKDIAAEWNLDPDKISVAYTAKTGEMGTTLATTDMAGTAITMNANVCGPKTFPGTFVHELTHIKYTALRNAYKKERTSVENELAQMSDEERLAAINSDGTLSGPLRNKYPLYQEFTSIYQLEQLRREGGVTPYSKQWWDKAKGGRFGSSAVYETLSEMARMKLERGELPGGPRHQALYALMNSHWYLTKPPGFK